MAGLEDDEAVDHFPFEAVGNPDRGRLGHGVVPGEDRLDLGRPQSLARHLDRVVAPAVEEPVAVLVDRGPVAVDPDVGPSRPVGRQVAFGVAPDPARHRGPGLGADQLADALAQRTARPASNTSTAIPSDGPTSEQGLSGVIGNADRRQAPTSVPPVMLMIGQPSPSDILEQPAPGLGVPRLARRGEDAQPAEVVRPDRLECRA